MSRKTTTTEAPSADSSELGHADPCGSTGTSPPRRRQMSASRKRQPAVQAAPRFLLRRQDAAESLGMSVDTFEMRVQPVLKLVRCGKLVLVPPSELERWAREHARFV